MGSLALKGTRLVISERGREGTPHHYAQVGKRHLPFGLLSQERPLRCSLSSIITLRLKPSLGRSGRQGLRLGGFVH